MNTKNRIKPNRGGGGIGIYSFPLSNSGLEMQVSTETDVVKCSFFN